MRNQMRILTFFILLLTSSVCEAQVAVTLRFRDECKGDVIEVAYELSQLDSAKFYNSHNGTIMLPSGGIYYLSAVFDRHTYKGLFGCTIQIGDIKVFSDTISIPKLLAEVPALHQQKTIYLTCSGVADGNYSEYNENGTRRIQGVFRNGLARGFLVAYDRNGKKKSKLKYRNGYLIRSRYY